MQYIAVIVIMFLLYQYWKKRRDLPRVKKTSHKTKGEVIDIDVVRHPDLEKGPLPYKRRPYLQERFERIMFEGLKKYLKSYAVAVYPQVDLLKLLYVPKSSKNYQSYLNKISGKSVEFVICDEQTLEPLVAVCLDRFSGDREQQQENNLFIDRAFKKAGLPLVRFAASDDAYNWEEVMQTLQPYVISRIKN